MDLGLGLGGPLRRKKVVIFDTQTNIITTYISRSEAGRALGGVHPDSVNHAVKLLKITGVSRLIKGRYRVILEETKDLPVIIPKGGKPEGSGLPPVQIEVFDLETTSKTIFPSITEAAKFIGCKVSTIGSYFTRNQNSPYRGRYYFKKLSN